MFLNNKRKWCKSGLIFKIIKYKIEGTKNNHFNRTKKNLIKLNDFVLFLAFVLSYSFCSYLQLL